MSDNFAGIRIIVPFALGVLLAVAGPAVAEGWKLPQLPPADSYGNLLINRTSTKNKVKPVTFSHWLHRRKHTCRVCHTELGFNMETNTTEITEDACRAGKFCGACHNGKISFKHEGNCEKCHNGKLDYGKEKFPELTAGLLKTRFGDGINWVASLDEHLISPQTYLVNKPDTTTFDRKLSIEAEWSFVPPSVFSHQEHTRWLDCNNCHPDIFTVKKKGTKDFTMEAILAGRYCGFCHLKVAFPMNDCGRCHPGIKEW
jgi:c(7)-type cytochrome triheme protein